MSVTSIKTAKGTIFSADGYSSFHRAYMQGEPTFTMFVPAKIVEKSNVTAENAVQFCQDVRTDRATAAANKIPPAWFARGVRIMGFRQIQ